MLFSYRYVQHDIEKVHGWLEHLVKHVWCRNSGAYSLALLHPDLREIVEDIANDDRITKDHLDGPIKRIDALFQSKLSVNDRAQVVAWFDANNDIEALCANDAQAIPATYADIRSLSPELEGALKEFCVSLFEDVLGLKAIVRKAADIDTHYDSFVEGNGGGKCPYCGYNDIKGQYNSVREAYDHFLPKATYPFNTVNFKNLAPMCHECNTGYKRKKDPIRLGNNGTRRKAFYSYAGGAPGVSIELGLANTDIDTLCPSDIALNVTAPGREEEVETWKAVFGIEERYKAKCCRDWEAKAWLLQVTDEYENVQCSSETLFQIILQDAQRRPWSGANFLKAAFLRACRSAGIV